MDPRMSRKRRIGSNHSSHLLRWGLTAAAAYGTYHLARWTATAILNRFKDDLEDEENEQRMLEVAAEVGLNAAGQGDKSYEGGTINSVPFHEDQLNLIVAQQETFTIMTELVSTLRKNVESSTDCTPEIQRIKQIRKEKRQINPGPKEASNNATDAEESSLWDEIKRKSITRFLLCIYAYTTLLIVIYIETNCLHRLSIDEARREEAKNALISYTFQKYIDRFVPELQQRIEHSVMKRLQCWNVLQIMDIGMEEFVSGLSSVRWNVESSSNTILEILTQSLMRDIDALPVETMHMKQIMDLITNIYQEQDFIDVWKDSNTCWFHYGVRHCVHPLFVSGGSSTTSNFEERTLVSVLRGLKGCARVFDTCVKTDKVKEREPLHLGNALQSFIYAEQQNDNLWSCNLRKLLTLIPN